MRNYVIKRLLFMVVTLVVITVVGYTMMRLAPGSPIRSRMLGGEGGGVINAQRKESLSEKLLREKYHLDKPALVGYFLWLKGILLHFDWGSSIVVDPGAPVLRVIGERMPATLKLNIFSLILIYSIAIPIGIYAAVWKGAWSERAITVMLFLLYSLPTFWVGLLLLMLFNAGFSITIPFTSYRIPLSLPVVGLAPPMSALWGVTFWQSLLMTAKHYILPVFCLTYAGLAGLSRFARVGVLETLRQDFVRTARAKGVPEWKVILKHVFRNSLIPLITLFAGLLPGLIAGSIIVEHIFTIQGMGSLSLLALNSRDYPLIMALFTIGAILTLLGILASDLLYAAVDPRIKLD